MEKWQAYGDNPFKLNLEFYVTIQNIAHNFKTLKNEEEIKLKLDF